MITSTGQYISGSITETGRIAFANVSETGEYAPTVTGFSMSSGLLVGGTFPLNTTAGITTAGGFLAGGSMVKKQIPYDLYSPAALAFTLTDASINFKLEQQP